MIYPQHAYQHVGIINEILLTYGDWCFFAILWLLYDDVRRHGHQPSVAQFAMCNVLINLTNRANAMRSMTNRASISKWGRSLSIKKRHSNYQLRATVIYNSRRNANTYVISVATVIVNDICHAKSVSPMILQMSTPGITLETLVTHLLRINCNVHHSLTWMIINHEHVRKLHINVTS